MLSKFSNILWPGAGVSWADKWRISQWIKVELCDFPGGPLVKDASSNAGTPIQSLAQELDPTHCGTAKPESPRSKDPAQPKQTNKVGRAFEDLGFVSQNSTEKLET